jgi:histidinol-phosphate aminotransferase
MKNLALDRIQNLMSYRPPLDGRTQHQGLRLDFNERTLSPSGAVAEAIKTFGNDPQTQLYPEYFNLETAIAEYAEVEPGQVMVTNGTDQAIDIILRTFSDRSDQVIIPRPSFAMYGQYARVNGNDINSPLYAEPDLAFPMDEVSSRLDDQAKLLILGNPNNPTGTSLSVESIARLARQAQDTVIYVDEAYFEFSQLTAAKLIGTAPNVIVSRTFSKAFGLAGLRIGYVLADRQYIAEMLKVRGPYDVNQLAAYAASAALANLEDTHSYAREVMNQAKPLVEEFFRCNGVEFYPSSGNFLLFRPLDALQTAQKLRASGVLVRPQAGPRVDGSLRVTIGTTPQMEEFINAYERLVLRDKQ